MPFLILLIIAIGITAFFVRENAKSNDLQAKVEAALLKEARAGARGVLLTPIGKEDLGVAHVIAKENDTRRIYRFVFNAMGKIHTRKGDEVHLFAVAGPGRLRTIYAASTDASGKVSTREILAQSSFLQDPRLFGLRRAVVRSLESSEKRRFLNWLEEARKLPANPWIMKHVSAWARRAVKENEVNLQISDTTDTFRFCKAVGACGPVEPLMELERYLDHQTDNDIDIQDELLTFADIARAIEFFGGRTGPRPEEDA